MNKIYVQGSLFLKKGPTVYDDKEIDNHNEFMEPLFGDYFKLEHGELNWHNVSNLHQLIITENGMYLRVRDQLGDFSESLYPITPKELEDNYIDFKQFLGESEYIGKFGVRTKPTKRGDTVFVDAPVIVLYRSDSHIILYDDKMMFKGFEPIQIYDSRFCQDWKFMGEQLDLYKEPYDLYRKLFDDSIKKYKSENEKHL